MEENKKVEIYLEKIINELDNKNCLVVLKGFDKKIFEKISKDIEPAFFPEIFEEKNFLEILEKNKRKLQKKIFSLEEGIFLVRYEELIAIRDALKLYENKIYIIENNFLKLYKYDFNNEDVEGYLKDKESEIIYEDKKESYLTNYFGDIQLYNGNYYVAYKIIDEKIFENIKIIKLFKNIKVEELKFEEDKIIDKNNLFLKSLNDKLALEELKNKIFNKEISEINFWVERKNLKEYNLKYEINFIINLCEINNIKIKIYVKGKEEKNIIHKEFGEILQKYWKSREFRKLNFYLNPDINKEKIEIFQDEIIEDVVSEIENSKFRDKFKDLFITAPTGAGKSIFFQIPAIYIKEKYNYLTIVISPLKSLMKDQIDNLESMGINYACFLNSDLSFSEKENLINKIKNNELSIVYMSPEFIQLNSDIEIIIGQREIGLLVVDEAHTVSTWGKNFRVDYLMIGNYINKIKKHKFKFPILALTATAIYSGESDTVFEIIESLKLNDPILYIGEVRKDNIKFKVQKFNNNEGNYDFNKLELLKERIKEKIIENKKSIFYFPYATQVNDTYSKLAKNIVQYVACYTGKILSEERNMFQKEFKENKKRIMMATKAFGMGIDIPDIERVYHFAPSGDLADYVQEIGRGARKKNIIGIAEIDFNKRDLKYYRILRQLSTVKQWQVKLVIEKIFELYRLNKYRPNILVSVESFSHIFIKNKEKDLENKIKQSLLFIEKDLINKYTYPIIIARPKVFFSSLYVVINNEALDKILPLKNIKYFRKVMKLEDNARVSISFNIKKEKEYIYKKDTGDIYEFETARYWEDNYSELSYPQFIREFFKGNIFSDNDVSSRIKLKVILEEDREASLSKFENYLNIIGSVLYSLNGYFDKIEFEEAIIKKIANKDKIFIKKIVNSILTSYSFIPDPIGNSRNNKKFLRQKKDIEKQKETYIFVKSNFLQFKAEALKSFNQMFTDVRKEEFLKYLNKDSKYLEIATILQTLEMATYEVSGGERSKIFIRINDPVKLENIAKNDFYKNEILTNIEKRGKRSEEILEEFFSGDFDNDERWNYIEDYFLGKI